ncbi:unnamed protein product [Prorocentrum cordatum]|uniref:Uncharacterized protein n=1 Tax=Prorocentrum cordatum TaxID=2364126 RepID=A0ABN9QGL6_9DINO|nr:unnamed protein product [Polarella glacialis]
MREAIPDAGLSACKKGKQKLWRCSARCGGETETRHSYSAGISACGVSEQLRQRAVALLSEMRGAKLEADVISFSVGVSTCERGWQWQRAPALLSEMREAILEPSVISPGLQTYVRLKRALSW